MERTTTLVTDTLPEWAAALCRNDTATVRALYKMHFPGVKQYVLQNSGTSDDAQDVFQEAISVLWLSVKEGRLVAGTDPGGFIYKVAKNKWLDVVRSAAHKHMKVVHDERSMDRPTDVSDDIEDRLVRLREVYAKLDDKCRTVLDRFYFERKDLAAIADEMGVEEESIRTIKYRCMMKLRAVRNVIRGEENEAS
ncbi:MAG: sigma-70 family RNA polymerase sigma factor [Flavobacteriales bacterium]|nr:sigma-70 family RNA polymerase sigma factor [Flavobacteriales bacterium]MBP7449021.1 sigma-70 family RNA polymerase sigma factor [Flavobacteriales bacterium]